MSAVGTTAVVVELVGGPFDGRQMAVPASAGVPREPVLYTVHCLANLAGVSVQACASHLLEPESEPEQESGEQEEAGETAGEVVLESVHIGSRRGKYDLILSSKDKGPTWLYRYRGSYAY